MIVADRGPDEAVEAPGTPAADPAPSAGASASASAPAGSAESAASANAAAGAPRRLALSDPMSRRAAEDRPETWGERAESDADRLAHYEAQRPPHHGS